MFSSPTETFNINVDIPLYYKQFLFSNFRLTGFSLKQYFPEHGIIISEYFIHFFMTGYLEFNSFSEINLLTFDIDL